MANQRVKDLAIDYLKENKRGTTSKIIEYINRRTKWGATTNQVACILSRHPSIEKVDFVDMTNPNGFRDRQCVWQLKN